MRALELNSGLVRNDSLALNGGLVLNVAIALNIVRNLGAVRPRTEWCATPWEVRGLVPNGCLE